jgi:hypothetical protein
VVAAAAAFVVMVVVAAAATAVALMSVKFFGRGKLSLCTCS